MKKWISALCALATITSSCVGLAGCKDKNVSLTMQEIYNANTTATLQVASEKLSVVKTNAFTDTVVRTYLDNEVYYEATTKNQITTSVCYNKAGTVGYVFDGTAYFGLLSTPEDLKAKPQQAYTSQVFEDKAMALTEEIVSAVSQKEGVLVQTKYSTENSAIVASRDGYTCGEGEYVQTKYVLEKDTYRVLSLERSVVTANGSTQYYKIEQETNVLVTDTDYTADLVPIITKIKAVQDKDNADNVWTLHVEANSNSPSEEDWKAVALKGDAFKIELGKRYPKVYADETLETEYVYAEGDDADGYLKVYAKRAFIAEDFGFTWQDILSANATDKLLNRYDNIRVSTQYEGDDDEIVTYIDKKMVYAGYGETGRCYLMDGTRGYKKSGDDYFVIIDKESNMQAKVNDIYETAVFSGLWEEKEVIDYAEVRGGKLYITTILSKADYEEIAGGEIEGDVAYFQSEYVFDAYTYRMYKGETYIVSADKTKVKEYTVTVEDNVEIAPDGAEEMYVKMTASQNTTDIIMFILNGEVWVKFYEGKCEQGDGLEIAYNNGSVNVYTDKNCENIFEGSTEGEVGLMLYVKPRGQGQ